MPQSGSALAEACLAHIFGSGSFAGICMLNKEANCPSSKLLAIGFCVKWSDICYDPPALLYAFCAIVANLRSDNILALILA